MTENKNGESDMKKILFIAAAISFSLSSYAAVTSASSSGAQVRYGRGESVCKAQELCLYADINYNLNGGRTKVLVIPVGTYVKDFAVHGFDYSNDGVSSIVNNTGKQSTLYSGLNLGGDVLPIGARQNISDLTKERRGSGNWNDQAKSTIAAPRIYASMPLALRGPSQAISGQSVSYEIEVSNDGPDDAPDAVVNMIIPKQLLDSGLEIICNAHEKASCGLASIAKLLQPLNLPKGGTAKITVIGAVSKYYAGELKIKSELSSPTVINSAEHRMGAVLTSFTKPVEPKRTNLNVSDSLLGSWGGPWPETTYIYSYRITLTANDTDVEKWRVSFDGLPKGIKIYNTLWTKIVEDGSTGRITLETPATGKNFVEKGKSLDIDLQLLYPDNNDAYKKLKNLSSKQLK